MDAAGVVDDGIYLTKINKNKTLYTQNYQQIISSSIGSYKIYVLYI